MNTSSSGRNRITFGETPASFRFEADVTFLAANDSSRYINFTFDYVGEADTGSAQGFRVTTAAANGLESCHGTRGSFTCATKAAPVSLGVGAQHHLALQIVDDEAEVRIDGSVVATPAISGCHSGQLGFLLDGATVAFDNVVVTAISQPLSSPRNLKTAAVADTITATWDEPASLGDDATGQPATLDHYEIAVKPSSELPAAADFTSTTERSFTVSGLAVGTYVASVRAVNSAGAASRIAITTATLSPRIAFGLPLTQRPGDWNSGHVQGMAVDINGGYLYYSFTSVFVKTDFQGRVIGTVTNYGPGALSDIVFNPADGKVYGALEYDPNFYAAIIDVDRIDRPNMDAKAGDGLFKVAYLPEVTRDYEADLDGDGHVGVEDNPPADHRFDVAGIDGTGIGPKFGETGGEQFLTVAYGVYGNVNRADNDHQVMLQYDFDDLSRYAVNLSATHSTDGPAQVLRAFVRTGNTSYGVQSLLYDPFLQRWFMAVYTGSKPQFPNYSLYAFEAATDPVWSDLVGTGEQGWLIALSQDGLGSDSGVHGWNFWGANGFESLGGGLYITSTATTDSGLQTADVRLWRWTGATPSPLTAVTADDIAIVPGFTSTASVTGTVGEPLAHTFAVAGTPAPQYRVSGGELPAGLTLDPRTGVLSGTPTAPGTFTAEATASNKVIADVAQTITITITAADTTAPTVTVKDGSIGRDGVYRQVSFKLHDAGKVDKVVLNGVVKDLSDNPWSDLNGVRPGVFGAVAGSNRLDVSDVAGNVTTVTFTLDTTAPTATVKPTRPAP